MEKNAWGGLVSNLNHAAEPVVNNTGKYETLRKKIGDSRFVLIGEATHGTQEFYQARIELSKELIEKNGFCAIAIEGDWPDTYSIHRYIQGNDLDTGWKKALNSFKRFPPWMWRNTTMPPFLQWLRHFNDKAESRDSKIGFYGLDLYSLNTSMRAVIDFLSKQDSESAELARLRYSCFDHLKLDPESYGYLTTLGIKKKCRDEVIEQWVELQNAAYKYIQEDEVSSEDEYFYACQNARIVKNAENYYRVMFEGHVASWNSRDSHMFETLNTLAEYLGKRLSEPSKIIVWAHNSHVGDARATEMGVRGELNLGQLVRQAYENAAYLIGFSTYQGTVAAASEWDGPVEYKNINPGLKGSYEELFHQVEHRDFMLHFKEQSEWLHHLDIPRLQRAIGVIYHPETELDSHYFLSRVTAQFDSILHFDTTTAVTPLD